MRERSEDISDMITEANYPIPPLPPLILERLPIRYHQE